MRASMIEIERMNRFISSLESMSYPGRKALRKLSNSLKPTSKLNTPPSLSSSVPDGIPYSAAKESESEMKRSLGS